MYPRFMFHAELAPEGKVIRSAEEEPTGDGWFDTPQKFDPAYVDPKPIAEPGAAPINVPNFRPQPYPSHRFSADGSSRVVNSAEEDALLNTNDWKHSPADFEAKAENPFPPTHIGQEPVLPKLQTSDGMKAELYTSKVQDVVARVEQLTDLSMLQLVHGFELANPKGARVGVIKAIEKRLAELQS